MRLRLDQRRPDLRAAAADARNPSRARWRRWRSCGRTASRCTATPTCPSGSSRSAASSRPICRRGSAKLAMLSQALVGFQRGGLRLHRHGPFRAAQRRAGGGQAPGPAAPQLPGLQHPARLRPDRRWACRPSAASAPPTARTPRRWRNTTTCSTRAACRWCAAWRLSRDDLARRAVIMALMCQGQVLLRVDRAGLAAGLPQLLRRRTRAAARLEDAWPGDARRRRHPGHAAGLVLRARRRDGVRPLPAGRSQPRAILAHHLSAGRHVDHARRLRRC